MGRALKWIAVVILVVLLLVAAGLGYVLYNSEALVAEFKPEIERIASENLGSRVILGKLTAKVFPSTIIEIGNAKISSRGAENEALELKKLELKVNPFALIKGRAEITNLAINNPELVIIKGPDGISIQGLPKPNTAGTSAAPQRKDDTTSQGKAAASPIDIALERFELREGSIVLKDTLQTKSYSLDKLNIVSALKLEKRSILLPSLRLDANALGVLPVSINASSLAFDAGSGKVTAKAITLSALDSNLNLSADLDIVNGVGSGLLTSTGVSLAKLSELGALVPPTVKDLNLSGSVKPESKFKLEPDGFKADSVIALEEISLVNGAKKISGVNGQIIINSSPTGHTVTSDKISASLNGQSLTAALNAAFVNAEQLLDLREIKLDGFGGTTKAQARVTLGNSLSSNFSAQGLNLASLLEAASGAAPPIRGALSELSGNIAGSLQGELVPSLRGNISLLVKDGVIPQVNLAAEVLKSVDSLPFVSGSLFSLIPPDLAPALKASDTQIQSLSGHFNIVNSHLNTSDLVVVSPLFQLNGSGSASFGGELNLNTTILFSAELSRALISRAKQLEAALDSSGRLPLPLIIKGTAPKLVVLPNAQKLLEIAGTAAVKKEAEKLLDKALKGKIKGLDGILGF